MQTIKILQWNVWYHEKYRNLIEFIKKIDPDVLCCQELTINGPGNPGVDVPQEIAKACGYSYYFQPMTIYGTEGETIQMGNGIFTKFPILNKNFKYVQKADPNIKSFETEDRSYVEVDLAIGNKQLRVGTVHLSYSSAFDMNKKRLAEAEKLYQAVQNNHERFILTGDMNATPNSPIIKTLEQWFVHAGPNLERPTWTTKPFSYQGFEANSRDWRLDYIFITEDINVLTDKIIETLYSDHLPIYAEIQI